MAEKPEVNKSQAIRDYFEANPKAKTQEVVNALARTGHHGHYWPCYQRQVHPQQEAGCQEKAKSQVAWATTTTAKKPEVNKTQAVRDYPQSEQEGREQGSCRCSGEARHYYYGQLRRQHQGHAQQASAGGEERSSPRAVSAFKRSKWPWLSSRPHRECGGGEAGFGSGRRHQEGRVGATL